MANGSCNNIFYYYLFGPVNGHPLAAGTEAGSEAVTEAGTG